MLPAERASDAVHVERHTMGTAPPGCFAWGEVAVQRAETLLERARRLQSGKRELVDAFLSSSSGMLRWTPPPLGSAFGWVEDLRGRPLLPLIEHGIATHGVIVSPGEFFGVPGAFRISWTDERDAVEHGLDLLPRVLEL
jgi:aspartate/methionine/tyrosine aminotransferase